MPAQLIAASAKLVSHPKVKEQFTHVLRHVIMHGGKELIKAASEKR